MLKAKPVLLEIILGNESHEMTLENTSRVISTTKKSCLPNNNFKVNSTVKKIIVMMLYSQQQKVSSMIIYENIFMQKSSNKVVCFS